MRSTFKKRFSPKVEPMNIVSLDKKKFLDNFVVLKTFKPSVRIFPVIKANAYGHGIDQFLEIFKKVDVPYLVVDSFPEYSIVHRHSKHNVLLLGETLSPNYKEFDLKRTTFAVYNIETLKELGKLKKNLKIHLFLNTGMNREGIQESMLENMLLLLQKYPKIQVEGVMSHLYDATNDQARTSQINLFKKMYYQILDHGHTPKWRHIANSAGFFKIDDSFFNACRPGLAFYGYNPLPESDPDFSLASKLQPVLSLTTIIISLNILKKGDGVSYDHMWKADAENTITATVPFGYAEGRMRMMSGKLVYKHKTQVFPQIGTICMNLSSFLGSPQMLIGDQVELISSNPSDPNSISSIAKATATIPYEILIKLDKGMRREIKK